MGGGGDEGSYLLNLRQYLPMVKISILTSIGLDKTIAFLWTPISMLLSSYSNYYYVPESWLENINERKN